MRWSVLIVALHCWCALPPAAFGERRSQVSTSLADRFPRRRGESGRSTDHKSGEGRRVRSLSYTDTTKSPTLAPSPLPTTSQPTPDPYGIANSDPPTTIGPTPPPSPPTPIPTQHPTRQPTRHPTPLPTSLPTRAPTNVGDTDQPSVAPTAVPTKVPTTVPTAAPTSTPTTASPSRAPTEVELANLFIGEGSCSAVCARVGKTCDMERLYGINIVTCARYWDFLPGSSDVSYPWTNRGGENPRAINFLETKEARHSPCVVGDVDGSLLYYANKDEDGKDAGSGFLQCNATMLLTADQPAAALCHCPTPVTAAPSLTASPLSLAPTARPTAAPTAAPTAVPTAVPTALPSTRRPSVEPTAATTAAPSAALSAVPTAALSSTRNTLAPTPVPSDNQLVYRLQDELEGRSTQEIAATAVTTLRRGAEELLPGAGTNGSSLPRGAVVDEQPGILQSSLDIEVGGLLALEASRV